MEWLIVVTFLTRANQKWPRHRPTPHRGIRPCGVPPEHGGTEL